jgi:mannose-6-phosphate isomerase-like protein (cupin superfamily)
MTAVLARPQAPLADLTAIARAFAENPELWQSQLQIPADGQDRWWTRLWTDDRVDVWLLSWQPGHATELHDHGTSAAAFSVVSGSLTEVRPGAHGHDSFERTPGSVVWLAPGQIHDVHAGGDGPAVSIHAYSPPLSQMTYFESASSGRGAQLHALRTVRTDEPERS